MQKYLLVCSLVPDFSSSAPPVPETILSPGNYVNIILICFHNYVVLGNIIAAWIKFTVFYRVRGLLHFSTECAESRREVSGMDVGCTKVK